MKYTNLINKEEFDKLTREQKIMAICQNVIDRLIQNNLLANSGSFVKYNGESKIAINKDVINQADANKHDGEICAVCAKGAILCTWVGNFNQFDDIPEVRDGFDDYIGFDWSGETPELLGIFGLEMLDMIEIAFELDDNLDWVQTVSGDDAEVLIEYFDTGEYHGIAEKHRLIAIMQHIIDNNGKFNFEQMIDENHKRENS